MFMNTEVCISGYTDTYVHQNERLEVGICTPPVLNTDIDSTIRNSV